MARVFRKKSKSLDLFRRTCGTNLYRDDTSPSIEQLRNALSKGTDVVPEEDPLWPDDEDEIGKICGLD